MVPVGIVVVRVPIFLDPIQSTPELNYIFSVGFILLNKTRKLFWNREKTEFVNSVSMSPEAAQRKSRFDRKPEGGERI